MLIAVGGKPTFPDLEGVDHCISSDGFFLLEEMPKSALVVGAGYIAVEMAGILHALGCETKLAVRGDKALRAFDDLMSDTLDSEMKRQGLEVLSNTQLAKVEDIGGGLKKVTSTDGVVLGEFEEARRGVVGPRRAPRRRYCLGARRGKS